MKKKNIFTLGILLLVCILPSSAQQKIVETQYFKNNPTLGGDVMINNSTKEIIGDESFTTFEINAPASGSYNLNM